MPTIFKDLVEVGDTAFNDPAGMPAGAIEWRIDVLDNWHVMPEADPIAIAIGGGVDGASLGESWPIPARDLLISGVVVTAERAEAETLMDVLSRDVFPRNRDVVLTRYETIPKFVTGRVYAREFKPVGTTSYRFVVRLLAGDPFKYDADPPADSSGTAGVAGQSSGGRSYPRTYPLTYSSTTAGEDANKVVLVNRGTADTYPTIILTGPLQAGGWRLEIQTEAGDVESLRFDVGLALGDVLVIDFRNHEALLNGFSVTTTIEGDFWHVPPGVNVVRLYADFDPAASLTATILSAWE